MDFNIIKEYLEDKVKGHMYYNIPDSDLKTLKKNNAILCGGAVLSIITGKKINDYDIYFKTVEDCSNASKWFMSEYDEYFTSLRAISFKEMPYQLIRHTDYIVEDPEKLVSMFDFRCCALAYDIAAGKLYIKENTYKDILSRELHIQNKSLKYPICTLSRIKKYINKGYTITGTELIKLALLINKVKIDTLGDLKDQLQGIDTLFLMDYTENLEDNHNYDVDEVFDGIDLFIENKEKEKQEMLQPEETDDDISW